MHQCSCTFLLILTFIVCGIIQLYFFPNVLYKHSRGTIWKNTIQTNVTHHNHVIIPHNIIQTGKHSSTSFAQSFKRLNPNYSYLFYNDLQAQEFVHKYMSPEIIHAYDMLPLAILKADYFRYIAIYVLGGVYSDGDTECLRPIDTWKDNHTNVSFIVGVEAEGSPARLGIARPLQLCQWTFASVPQHPILKRIIDKIEQQTKIYLNTKLSMQIVFNWTGPGAWTDAVFDYIKETYHVEWTTFSKLKHGRLIGDVYVLPPAAFQPMAYYLGAKGRKDKEARIWHYYLGSWKRQIPRRTKPLKERVKTR